MAVALIALGSNLGDRAGTLDRALSLLDARDDTSVIARSRFHATPPIGGPVGQGEFLNGAALLDTALSPETLLAQLQNIEDGLGRRRDEIWDARTVDLDLLLYEQIVRDDPQLTLPHPRMAFRYFVLRPSAEVAPEFVHPKIDWTVQQLLDHLVRSKNYVAVTGPPGAGKRDLVERAHAELGGRMILDVSRPNDSGLPGSLQAEMEWIRRRVDQLTGREDGDADRLDGEDPGVLMLSDFWLEESLAHATPSETLLAACRAARQSAPQPRLVVLLDATWAQVANQSPLERSAWEPIRETLIGLVEKGGHGPILRLDAGNPDWATREVIAAARAMQPIGICRD